MTSISVELVNLRAQPTRAHAALLLLVGACLCKLLRALRAAPLCVVLALFLQGAALSEPRIVVEPPDQEIVTLLESAFELPANSDDLEPSAFRDLLRIQRDRMNALLRGLGYYAADTVVLIRGAPVDLDAPSGGATVEGVPTDELTFVATTGPVYRVRSFRVFHGAPDVQPPSEVAGVIGLPATAEIFAIVESDWRTFMRDVGHPFAIGIKRVVTEDDSARVVDVELTVEAGPVVRFGNVRFLGVSHTDRALLQASVGFSPGERYREPALWELRSALERLPGIDEVKIRLAPFPDDQAMYPVIVTLVETPRPDVPLPLKDVLGVVLLSGAAVSVSIVQVSRARRADASRWTAHWYAIVIGLLLIAGGVFAALRVLSLLD